jgi:hypothetical protein
MGEKRTAGVSLRKMAPSNTAGRAEEGKLCRRVEENSVPMGGALYLEARLPALQSWHVLAEKSVEV